MKTSSAWAKLSVSGSGCIVVNLVGVEGEWVFFLSSRSNWVQLQALFLKLRARLAQNAWNGASNPAYSITVCLHGRPTNGAAWSKCWFTHLSVDLIIGVLRSGLRLHCARVLDDDSPFLKHTVKTKKQSPPRSGSRPLAVQSPLQAYQIQHGCCQTSFVRTWTLMTPLDWLNQNETIQWRNPGIGYWGKSSWGSLLASSSIRFGSVGKGEERVHGSNAAAKQTRDYNEENGQDSGLHVGASSKRHVKQQCDDKTAWSWMVSLSSLFCRTTIALVSVRHRPTLSGLHVICITPGGTMFTWFTHLAKFRKPATVQSGGSAYLRNSYLGKPCFRIACFVVGKSRTVS